MSKFKCILQLAGHFLPVPLGWKKLPSFNSFLNGQFQFGFIRLCFCESIYFYATAICDGQMDLNKAHTPCLRTLLDTLAVTEQLESVTEPHLE